MFLHHQQLHSFVMVFWLLFWTFWTLAAIKSVAQWTAWTYLRLAIVVIYSFAIGIVDFRVGMVTSMALQFLGATIFTFGLLMAVISRVQLGINWGPTRAKMENSALVTTDVYAIVRNPIYTGMLVGMIGAAIATNWLWLVTPLGYGSYLVYSTLKEEENLTEEHGRTYLDYQSETRWRLMPFIW